MKNFVEYPPGLVPSGFLILFCSALLQGVTGKGKSELRACFRLSLPMRLASRFGASHYTPEFRMARCVRLPPKAARRAWVLCMKNSES